MDDEQVNSIVQFATGMAVLGLISGMIGGMARMMAGSSKKASTYLAKTEPPPKRVVTVTCPICGKVIEVGEYDSVTRTEALKRHIEAEHGFESHSSEHHSMWLTSEQREALEKKYGAVATRWGEEVAAVGDLAMAEKAAKVFYEKMRGAIGIV